MKSFSQYGRKGEEEVMENENGFINPKTIKVYRFLAMLGITVAAAIMFVVNRTLDFMVIFQFVLYFLLYMSLINEKKGKFTSQDAIWMIVTIFYSIVMCVYFGMDLQF